VLSSNIILNLFVMILIDNFDQVQYSSFHSVSSGLPWILNYEGVFHG
jgi:hypothetical protein